jgi:Mg2+/citrate symporter
MNMFEGLIPISLFICILLAIKFVVDAHARRKLVEAHASEELIKAMLQAEEQTRRHSALKWGLVLTLLGLAFGLISALHLQPDNPGAWGLLIGAAGIGMLGYHAIANRLQG